MKTSIRKNVELYWEGKNEKEIRKAIKKTRRVLDHWEYVLFRDFVLSGRYNEEKRILVSFLAHDLRNLRLRLDQI